VPGAPVERHAALAKTQGVKGTVVREVLKQRAYVEGSPHLNAVLKIERQAVCAEKIRSSKQGQPVALMLPELASVEQLVKRGKHGIDGPLVQAVAGQLIGGFTQQILETCRVLLALVPNSLRGYIDGDAGRRTCFEQFKEVTLRDRVDVFFYGLHDQRRRDVSDGMCEAVCGQGTTGSLACHRAVPGCQPCPVIEI